jgi:hypothetical protein
LITYLEVYPLLAAACSTYPDSKDAALAQQENGEFLRVGQIVSHLIERLACGETGEFPAVFGVVEWVLEEGDSQARSVITDGFFDDLTDMTFYSGAAVQPSDFAPWLGPQARQVPSVQPLL